MTHDDIRWQDSEDGTHWLSFSVCVVCFTNIARKDDNPWSHRDDMSSPGHVPVPLS